MKSILVHALMCLPDSLFLSLSLSLTHTLTLTHTHTHSHLLAKQHRLGVDGHQLCVRVVAAARLVPPRVCGGRARAQRHQVHAHQGRGRHARVRVQRRCNVSLPGPRAVHLLFAEARQAERGIHEMRQDEDRNGSRRDARRQDRSPVPRPEVVRRPLLRLRWPLVAARPGCPVDGI